MDGFVEAMHTAPGHRETVATSSAAVDESPRDERDIARQLAATLDRAMELEQWDFAERVAAQSIRIAQDHPLLAERIARLRAARGEFETALTIIDSCPQQHASMRLLRAVCLLQLGRLHEAHGDLYRWSRKSTAPLAARLVLALLEYEAGDSAAAFEALQRNLRQIEDPQSLAALVLMAVAEHRDDAAAHWARRLSRATTGQRHPIFNHVLLLATRHDTADESAGQPIPAGNAGVLAGELLGDESVIPALVEAACLAPNPSRTGLLIDAITQALDDLDDQATACDALVRLHDLAGERDLAEAWRGRASECAPRDDVIASIGHQGVSMADQQQSMVWERAA